MSSAKGHKRREKAEEKKQASSTRIGMPLSKQPPSSTQRTDQASLPEKQQPTHTQAVDATAGTAGTTTEGQQGVEAGVASLNVHEPKPGHPLQLRPLTVTRDDEDLEELGKKSANQEHKSQKMTSSFDPKSLPTWGPREEQLVSILSKFENYSYVYMGFRANHLSQGATALYRLGAIADKAVPGPSKSSGAETHVGSAEDGRNFMTDEAPEQISMNQWFNTYTRMLEAPTGCSLNLTASTWMCYLGRTDVFPAFLSYFKGEYERMLKERCNWHQAYMKSLQEAGHERSSSDSSSISQPEEWEMKYAWLTPGKLRGFSSESSEAAMTDMKPCSVALCMPPWRRLLREYFLSLAPGMMGGALHGMIQVGWALPHISQAVRALKRLKTAKTSSTETNEELEKRIQKYETLANAGVQMMIQGLAWMATTYRGIEPTLACFGPAQRTANISRIAALASQTHGEAVSRDCAPYEEREDRSRKHQAEEAKRRRDTLGSSAANPLADDVCNRHPDLARASFDAATGACIAGLGRLHQALGLVDRDHPQLQAATSLGGEVQAGALHNILERSAKYPYSQEDAGFLRRVWSATEFEEVQHHARHAATYAIERLIALSYDRDLRGKVRGIVEPITMALMILSLICKNDFFVLHLITSWFGMRQILHHLDIMFVDPESSEERRIEHLLTRQQSFSDHSKQQQIFEECRNPEKNMYRSPFVRAVKCFYHTALIAYVAQGCPAAGSPELNHILRTGLGAFALLGHETLDPTRKLQVIPSWKTVVEQMEPLTMPDVHRAKLTMVMLLDAAATSLEGAEQLMALKTQEENKDSLLDIALDASGEYKVRDALEGVHMAGVLNAFSKSYREGNDLDGPPRQVRVVDDADAVRAHWLSKILRLAALKASAPFRFGQVE